MSRPRLKTYFKANHENPVLQAAAYSLAQMTVGRLIVGFGVGSAAMIVPVSSKDTLSVD